MKMLILLSLFASYALTLSGHPMIMISVISMQALLVALILWLVVSNPWFSYILFLVFMGGLMVLFIYISSLASNESISLNLESPTMKIAPVLGIVILFIYISSNSQSFKESSLITSLNLIFSVYTPNIMYLTLTTMVYLLLALIIIVKITSLKEGALRNLK